MLGRTGAGHRDEQFIVVADAGFRLDVQQVPVGQVGLVCDAGDAGCERFGIHAREILALELPRSKTRGGERRVAEDRLARKRGDAGRAVAHVRIARQGELGVVQFEHPHGQRTCMWRTSCWSQ